MPKKPASKEVSIVNKHYHPAPIMTSLSEAEIRRQMDHSPLLRSFIERFGVQAKKQKRDHYLPRASALEKLTDFDREALLKCHQRRLEKEVCRHVLTTCTGRRAFLKSARDRMRRLERSAHSFNVCLEESPQRPN